jgi:predicted ATPase/class 3 adenylate cyclase
MDCQHCRAPIILEARYCSNCGVAVHGAESLEAERRHIAVVFCDLAGSTELAARLDPEDFSAIIRRYHARCAEIIRGLSGHVAQCLGDGVLAYFGYPESHENDALLGVRAGLRLVAAVNALNNELRVGYGIELSVRVGVHAGVVVMADVGIDARRERLALGSVPNMAARIQGVAGRNTVLVSEAVQRLVQGYIELTPAPAVKLRGFGDAQGLYEVRGELSVATRFEASTAGGLTPFVGSRDDVDRVLQAWHAAENGEFRVVMLEGEAGIGKSRRVHILKNEVGKAPHRLLELQCTPETSHSAFYPVALALRSALLADLSHAVGTLLERLERAVLDAGLDPTDAVPLLAPLLSISTDDRYQPFEASAIKAREVTLNALANLLVPPLAIRPTVLVIEDVHWADASTLDLIQRMLQQPPRSPALMVMTRRSDFELSLQPSSALERITIPKLSRADAQRIAAHVAGGDALSASSLEALLQRSDGVPLFVEELTKTLLETGALSQESAATSEFEVDEIPSSVRGLLGSRLDRLGGAKAVMQLGAVLGRDFRQEVLEAVSPLVDLRVRDHLRELLRTELLFASDNGTLSFRHALIRDAAYATLLKSTRRHYHERTADVMLEKFPKLAAAQPELVAQHYDRAVRPDRAVPYWIAAGQRALGTNAHREAGAHAHAGLVALAQLADSAERRRWELELRSLLGMALIATEGYGSAAAEQNFKRAGKVIAELSDRASPVAGGDYEKAFVTTWGVWAYHLVRSELEPAQRAAEQLHALALRASRDDFRREAHVTRGQNYFYFSADYASALRELEAALVEHEVENSAQSALRVGQDPVSVATSVAIWIDALTGNVETAYARLTQGLEHTSRRAHPFSDAYLASHAAVFCYLIRDHAACMKHAERALALGDKYGFPTWLAVGAIYRGWARGVQGDVAAGLAELSAHLGIFGPIGVSLQGPTRLELLSQVQQLSGDLAGAFGSVCDALALARRTGEQWYVPELERRRAELGIQLDHPTTDMESSLRRALALCREHGNRLFELRTALTFARSGLGRDEGRRLVRSALSAFPVNSSLWDVSEARALLESS